MSLSATERRLFNAALYGRTPDLKIDFEAAFARAIASLDPAAHRLNNKLTITRKETTVNVHPTSLTPEQLARRKQIAQEIALDPARALAERTEAAKELETVEATERSGRDAAAKQAEAAAEEDARLKARLARAEAIVTDVHGYSAPAIVAAVFVAIKTTA